MGVYILYLEKQKGARKVDEGVFLVYLEKREGWVGRAYAQRRLCGTSTTGAPGRTIGTVTVSGGDRAVPCKDGARQRRARINDQSAQVVVQGSSAAIVDDEFEAPTATVAGDDKKASRMRRARTANA
jgi:hypothetical protein